MSNQPNQSDSGFDPNLIKPEVWLVLQRAARAVRLPWYIDEDNYRSLVVKDSGGDVVYMEDWGSLPDEMSWAQKETIISAARLNADFMVAASSMFSRNG